LIAGFGRLLRDIGFGRLLRDIAGFKMRYVLGAFHIRHQSIRATSAISSAFHSPVRYAASDAPFRCISTKRTRLGFVDAKDEIAANRAKTDGRDHEVGSCRAYVHQKLPFRVRPA
jgi:hypothetical protein